MRIFTVIALSLVMCCTAIADGAPGAPDVYFLNETAILAGATPSRDVSAKTLSSQTINTSIRNLVIIAAGQSNFGNTAPDAYTPAHPSQIDNLNPYDDGIYHAIDPLVGCGAVWPYPSVGGHAALILADALIGANLFDRVIIEPVSVNGTAIAQWATGSLAARIPVALKRLTQRGIVSGPNVTIVILWGQGETDQVIGTSQVAYMAAFATLYANVAAAGFTGKWFVAEQTYFEGAASPAIEAAQASVVDNAHVFHGANADALINNMCGGSACRFTGDHFTDAGVLSYATDPAYGWLAALEASGAPF